MTWGPSFWKAARAGWDRKTSFLISPRNVQARRRNRYGRHEFYGSHRSSNARDQKALEPLARCGRTTGFKFERQMEGTMISSGKRLVLLPVVAVYAAAA